MSLAARINMIRKEKKIGIDELSALSGIPKGTLSKITAGITQNPSLETVRAIAVALGCSMDDFDDAPKTIKNSNLTPSGQRIGRAYEKATPPVRRTVEVALEPYFDDIADNVIHVDFEQSEQPASAGTGISLRDEAMTTIKVRLDALPNGYERMPTHYFGVPIYGNSMEPRYQDGDILIVSKEPVNVGEIGVFTMDGEGYVKQLGAGVLHSLNPKYDDIPLTEDIRCNGRVVGVLNADDIEE